VVEFALILPVTMLIVLGMIELGRAFVFGVSVQDGAREAARLAAKASYDTTVGDTAVLGRLVAASNPALVGCAGAAWAVPITCGSGTWTLSINIVNGASSYSTIAAARSAGALTGSNMTITAKGAVGLVPGLNTGVPGLTLANIGVQGQAVMVIL
jgi:Flp pilus assembly protein TadG